MAATIHGKSLVILFRRISGVLPIVSRILFFISIQQMYKGLLTVLLHSVPCMSGISLSLEIFISQYKTENYIYANKNIYVRIIENLTPVYFICFLTIGGNKITAGLIYPMNLTYKINKKTDNHDEEKSRKYADNIFIDVSFCRRCNLIISNFPPLYFLRIEVRAFQAQLF